VPDRSALSQGAEAGQLNFMQGGQFGGQNYGAGNYLQQSMAGNFLNGNQYIDQMAQTTADNTTRNFMRGTAPLLHAGFGRGGSGAETNRMNTAYDQLGRNIYEGEIGLRHGNYNMERGLQNQAAALAPGQMQAEQNVFTRSAGLGAGQEAFQGSQFADQQNRFNWNRDEQWQRLAREIAGYGSPIMESENMQTGATSSPGAAIGGGLLGLLGTILTGGAAAAPMAAAAAPLSAASAAAGGWGGWSSRALKHKIDEVDSEDVSRRFELLDVDIWRYREDFDQATDHDEHIGPYAEDVRDLFGVGNGQYINGMDMQGMAFAAIKGLTKRVRELEERLEVVAPTDLGDVAKIFAPTEVQ
jgi:hypothetical protein